MIANVNPVVASLFDRSICSCFLVFVLKRRVPEHGLFASSGRIAEPLGFALVVLSFILFVDENLSLGKRVEFHVHW